MAVALYALCPSVRPTTPHRKLRVHVPLLVSCRLLRPLGRKPREGVLHGPGGPVPVLLAHWAEPPALGDGHDLLA